MNITPSPLGGRTVKWSWWRFGWGAAGAFFVHFTAFVTSNPLPTIGPLFIIYFIVLCIAGGGLAVAWGEESPFLCL